MALKTAFILRISTEDRRLLAEKAERENRSSADIVRRLIRQAVKQSAVSADDQRDGAFVMS